MAKLTKDEARKHAQACELLQKEQLTIDDRIFVLENWHEGATHINGIAGAFFTPTGLARDFAIDAGGGHRTIDLCAGIGGLSFWLFLHERIKELVCVEINPAYIEVGRKILPEATWVQADIFQLPDLGHFDLAIGNPPFGATNRRGGQGPRYAGRPFEYHVIDLASDLADRGAFIVGANAAPFCLRGSNHERKEHEAYATFRDQTSIELWEGCGVDTDLYRTEWHGVAPVVEIVTTDFDEAREKREEIRKESERRAKQHTTGDLFAAVA